MLTESPDGQTLAAADPYTLWLVPAGGGEPTVRFRPQSQNFGQITAVAWSRDGRSLVIGLSRQGARAPELIRLPVADGAPQQLVIDTPLGDVAWFRSLHLHPTTEGVIAATPWGWRGEVWRLSNFLPRP